MHVMEVVLGLVPGLDGCWALDRFTNAHHGPTSTAMSVGRARALPARGDARVADELARGMADVVQRRRLPRDVVVAAVPSANPLSADLAARVADLLGRSSAPLLGVRAGWFGKLDGQVRGRITVKVRTSPPHVLLVDDLVHTGVTVSDCAELLRARGAVRVWAVAAVVAGDLDPI